MKRAVAALCLTLLTGCAGLHTAWVLDLRMGYQTPTEETDEAPTRKVPQ
jgi:hypothetical protein